MGKLHNPQEYVLHVLALRQRKEDADATIAEWGKAFVADFAPFGVGDRIEIEDVNGKRSHHEVLAIKADVDTYNWFLPNINVPILTVHLHKLVMSGERAGERNNSAKAHWRQFIYDEKNGNFVLRFGEKWEVVNE